MKIEITISSEGGKREIYDLRERVSQLLSSYSCRYTITLTDNQGLVETTSGMQELRGVPVEDVIEAEIVEPPKELT